MLRVMNLLKCCSNALYSYAVTGSLWCEGEKEGAEGREREGWCQKEKGVPRGKRGMGFQATDTARNSTRGKKWLFWNIHFTLKTSDVCITKEMEPPQNSFHFESRLDIIWEGPNFLVEVRILVLYVERW